MAVMSIALVIPKINHIEERKALGQPDHLVVMKALDGY
jgi:hypothetical protein